MCAPRVSGQNGDMPSLPFSIEGLRPRAWNTYSFRTRWQLRADPDEVYEVLADVGEYCAWWPQIREGIQTGEGSGDLVIRSKLPVDLRVHLEQRRRDPGARVLIARLTGDIEGGAAWRVEALPAADDRPAVEFAAGRPAAEFAAGRPAGQFARAGAAEPLCAAYFVEDVEARAAVLRRLAPLARPAFIANHAAMMRDGERSLARFLAERGSSPR